MPIRLALSQVQRLVVILVMLLPLFAVEAGDMGRTIAHPGSVLCQTGAGSILALQAPTGARPTIEQEAPALTLTTFIVATLIITIIVIIIVAFLRRSR